MQSAQGFRERAAAAERFREAVESEHRTMAALFNQYLKGLREAYAEEIATTSVGN